MQRFHIYLSFIKTSQNESLYKNLPIEDPQSLVDLDIQQPTHPIGYDLLVAIKAISVNPLDTKVRRGTIPPPENENMPHILGWDAAGEVIAAGSDCTLFQKGDAVYYAGSITRQGTLRISSGRRTYCWKKTKIT